MKIGVGSMKKEYPMELTEEQHEAIELCANRNNKLAGVTGEAGTGKTTILKQVHELTGGDAVCLCAPTGRAAKRISEATGIPALTIHRMMRFSMPEDDDEAGMPAYDKNNRLPYKTILVDESSMVNEDLYRCVIDAMQPSSVIRFFGDANQLPPVEGKSPFIRLLDKFPSAVLTNNFRSQDGVVSCARDIIRGRIPSPNDQFEMMNPGTGNMLPIIDEMIDDTFRGLNSQVIIPTKKGKYGTFAINKHMQRRLNGDAPTMSFEWDDKYSGEREKRTFGVGDKVIWTKNDYKLNLFNGEIGWVMEVDDEGGDICCRFDGRDKIIPPILESYDPRSGRPIFNYDPRRNMDLAYAITTHKAQGSEFDRVLLMLNNSFVLNRANFYTAVTRARKHVWCVFGSGGLRAAMKPVRNT